VFVIHSTYEGFGVHLQFSCAGVQVHSESTIKSGYSSRAEKEKLVSTAFFQYLVSTGPFKDFGKDKDMFKDSIVCSKFWFSLAS